MIRLVFAEPRANLLGRLSRLRWRRAFERCAADGVLEVRQETALAAPGAAEALAEAARRKPGAVLYPAESAAGGAGGWSAPAVSTLRELENACSPAAGEVLPLGESPAEWAARFVPAAGGAGGDPVVATGFRVVRFPPSFGVREEILARIPHSARRLLDVGCGAGETAAAARERFALRAEGIERDPALAAAARKRLDAVHEGDARERMEALADRGERFDALLFADVLEHLPDPRPVMEAARALAAPRAVVVVSVPNAASAPVVADLVAGRFDPVASGPEDAGHLRWFRRESLRRLLEETGFAGIAIAGIPVPRDEGIAAALASAGLRFDPEALGAIQWIATARA